MAGLVLVGTLALAGGVAAFFALPAGHRLGIMVAIAGGSLLAVSIFVKLSLPWLLPIGVTLFLAGIGWSVYRLARHKPLLPDIDGDGRPL